MVMVMVRFRFRVRVRVRVRVRFRVRVKVRVRTPHNSHIIHIASQSARAVAPPIPSWLSRGCPSWWYSQVPRNRVSMRLKSHSDPGNHSQPSMNVRGFWANHHDSLWCDSRNPSSLTTCMQRDQLRIARAQIGTSSQCFLHFHPCGVTPGLTERGVQEA